MASRASTAIRRSPIIHLWWLWELRWTPCSQRPIASGPHIFIVGGFLTLVIVTLSWFLARETRRRRQRELALHAEDKTRKQKTVLDTALNNMSQGLLMFELP